MAARAPRTRAGARAVAAATLLLIAGAAAAGKAYRWIDDQGHVHYTDAPPPESARAAGQTKGESRPDGGASGSAGEPRERPGRNRMLLQWYASLEELERTRDRRLEGVEAELEFAAHRLGQARSRVDRLVRRLAELDDDERRAGVEARLEDARERLDRRERELARLKAKRQRIIEAFARDRERYLELKRGDFDE